MTPEKLDWILAEHEHGPEWLRVFRIRDADAKVTTSWHYADAGEAPRLVTAYPTS